MYQNIFIEHIHGQNFERNRDIIHLWDDQKGYQTFDYENYAYRLDPNGDYKTLFGNTVSKTKSWTKWDVDDGKIFESDVPTETRVLVDLYHESDDISIGHRLLIFDIEVEVTEGLPDKQKASNTITTISCYDDTSKEFFVFVLDKEGNLQQTRHENEEIIPFKREKDLLIAFLQKWEEIQPTIISGWNCDQFDIPYLYNRLINVLGKQQANRLSPIGLIYYNQNRCRYFIAGISSLDYLSLYKKFTYTDQPSHTLDFISREELGEGKIENRYGSLDEFRKKDINGFIEYNLTDTKLVYKLDKKLNLIELVRGVCHKGHVSYESVFYNSRWIEGAMLIYMKSLKLVAPNKNPKEQELMHDSADSYSGAYVKDPVPKKHQWIFDLDFTSLYPSIVVTLNISPETKIGKIEGWDAEKFLSNKDVDYQGCINGDQGLVSGHQLEKIIKTYDYSISANGILYQKSKQGIIPQILEEWTKDKDNYHKLMNQYGNKGDTEKSNYYEQRRTIAKTMLNCFSYDTEVMTCEGIKNIKDVKVGDLVYSINPNTLKVEIKPISRTYDYEYNGDMVEIKNNHVDFLITPNHKLLTSKIGKHEYKNFQFENVENLLKDKVRRRLPYRTEFPSTRYIDKIKLNEKYNDSYILKNGMIRDDRQHTKFQPNEYSVDKWIEFIGWYISEGSLYTSKEKFYENNIHRGISYTVYIAQEKYNEDIFNLLNSMNIRGIYKSRDKGYSFSSKTINNILENECGRGSENKKIPDWVFNLDIKYLTILFDTLMKGDGHKRKDCYTTKSKTLAYQFIRLAHHIGKYAYIRNNDSCYRIQICHKRGQSPVIKHNHRKIVKNNSNKIYCVEVEDNHTVLAGRNSKFNWIGQSVYGVLGLPVFRFYDVDNAESVTKTGVMLIKYAEKMANYYYSNIIGYEMEIEMENGLVKKFNSNDELKIKRDKKIIKILAKNIKETDEFF